MPEFSSETHLYLILLAAFLVLVFEFINGFHDTANAVATVIYTRTLKPIPAVLWSGLWNFLGALFSTGAVAISLVHLIPKDLLADAHSAKYLAVVLAIPVSAILWNFGTWYFGIPASSSHTLIGSILGVGLMHSYSQGAFGAGVNWHKAGEVGLSLLISPFMGFVAAALVLTVAKLFLKNPALYKSPDKEKKPPLWMRGLLILTCTGVSFAHGSNDGQKGMGLLVIVLAAAFPTLLATDGSFVIPFWIKLIVAATLGCGTMIGWKRIVVTIGEKIGKAHMSYAEGASAELVAMGTIEAASAFGLPVSTTHVLSSGVAGAMFANKSGLQERTIRNILLAWIFTLPASVILGSGFFAASLFLLLQVLGLR